MRKLLKQTLALATSVAMCLSMASPVLTVYAEDATVPTADSYVDAGDTADVSPFDSIAAPDTSDTEAADTETADTESADTEAADTETADAETTDTESADTETADAETTDTETADTEPAAPEPEAQPAEPATPETAAEPLTVLDPESTVITANVGDTVTLSADLNREDVEVTYQWQVLRRAADLDAEAEPIYNYAEDEPTWYVFPLTGVSEYEALQANPDMTWNGIETYLAIVDALDEIDEDSTAVSLAWRTENYALEGYAISAANVDGQVQIYADKGDTRYTATLNSESKWEFDATEGAAAYSWQDIEGATDSRFSFEVTNADYRSSYRCAVTVTDADYLAQCARQLADSGTELTDEQRAADQVLYSLVMTVESPEEAAPEAADDADIALYAATGSSTTPHLSADAQWIEGLNNNYQYITKDTYDRITKWVAEGKISPTEARRYWTSLGSGGWNGKPQIANVLDDDGLPTGETRTYVGFNLTDGALEVNSEWYGKTVYFRVSGSSGTGTAVKIPAYTDLTVDDNGNYIESSAGTRYKKAITFLNPYVRDSSAMYGKFIAAISDADGWLYDVDSNWNSTGAAKDIHIRVYTIECEDFNRDPARYMLDAEGNYRMDSVGWGVCTSDEPDLSGKAYWQLKDYIANGYGFLTGHDTLYAYAGAYYDAYGTDLDESSIDPNDGTTWYYSLNSWLPYGTTKDGQTNNQRGGHFYMNQLMGSNKGNVNSGTVSPSDAPGLILSTGGSHGVYGKNIQYGSNTLHIVQNGYTAAQAVENPKYRTPTNYPYSFVEGQDYSTGNSWTHTNQQAAFGTLWVDYAGGNLAAHLYGYYDKPLNWTINNQTGTNNFYLSGNGNYLMNQIGHLPTNAATPQESAMFINSVMYVSQRKQCEICAANQSGQETVHFVRRISSTNFKAVTDALRSGGSYWYPLDGCYMLTEDITLPEDWTPIAGFTGHWSSDVYKVTLNSKGTPLLANTSADGPTGWNLGTDPAKGTPNVFDANMTRTTGVARVLGDLNDLFGTNTSYAGYVVKILGSDNPAYMQSSEVYSCTVNSDSKYVISSLPCIYDADTQTGVLTARVYRPDGSEVTEYGAIRTNVSKLFWDNDETTPLYLGGFTAEPVQDEITYESAQAFFVATATADEQPRLTGWQYRKPGSDWQDLPAAWGTVDNTTSRTADGDHVLRSTLTLPDTDPAWNGYEFRAVFASDHHGSWNSYEYYRKGAVGSNTAADGYTLYQVADTNIAGKLTVLLWPAYARQSADKTVYAGSSAVFSASGWAPDGAADITAVWQYSTVGFDAFNGGEYLQWQDVAGDPEWGGLEQITISDPTAQADPAMQAALAEVNPAADWDTFCRNASVHRVTGTLTLNKVDTAQSGTHFRLKFTATSAHGTVYEWYSSLADETTGRYNTDTGEFGSFVPTRAAGNSNILNVKTPDLEIVTTPSAQCGGAANPDTMTPDSYGQMLLLANPTATVADGSAVYEAILYYQPGDNNYKPTPQWQYMTYKDRKPTFFADANSKSGLVSSYSLIVSVSNTDLGVVTSGKYTGWYAIKSVLTIGNVPLSMYNTETLLKYYFRCIGTQEYTTVKDSYTNTRADQWGGLAMDYAIDIQHNGVLSYGNTNTINGTTVTDAAGIAAATSGKSSSTWAYPKLKINLPSGRHVNTAIVYLEGSYDSRDSININTGALQSLGITVQTTEKGKLVLVSSTKDRVETSTWENALRNYVTFTTYDRANFDNDRVANGTTGGAKVRWYVDEMRLVGVTIDPSSGKAYKVVTTTSDITWNQAFNGAKAYNSDLGVNGYLAEITSSAENSLVHSLLGSNVAYIGANKTTGSWRWKTSNSAMSYKPSFTDNGNYLTMQADGSWKGVTGTTTTTKNVTAKNIGRPASWSEGSQIGQTFAMTGPDGFAYTGTRVSYYQSKDLNTEHADTNSTWYDTWFDGVPGIWYYYYAIPVTHGHKYYIRFQAGDYGDNNGKANIYSDFGSFEGNWNSGNNSYTSGLNGIYTYNGWGSSSEFTVTTCGHGDNYTGNGAVIYSLTAIDLTATFGSGNEDAAGAKIKSQVDNHMNSYGATYWTSSYTVQVTTQATDHIRKYVVEYDLPNLAFAVTNHSASDTSYIGTGVAAPTPSGEKALQVKITGSSKVYDGKQISPTSLTVSGSTGASLSLLALTVTTPVSGNKADYPTTQLPGTSWQNTGAVNATTYHVTVGLTDAAKNAGWVLASGSTAECDLIIYQRPVNVYSYHNDKVYDQQCNGQITNIQAAAATTDTGIVAGDTVLFTPDTVEGYYVDASGKGAVHNSKGKEYTMLRTGDLRIVHNATSDPHYNYKLGTEDYTGAITPRPVTVHSLYLDNPEQPRNVKTYDGTDKATIRDIILDNVLGDAVTLKDQVMTGTYATAEAGETLNPDGTPQTDRLKKLTENVITADTHAELQGDIYGDYYIAEEKYSGAISRALLEVHTKSERKMYGAADMETPWFIRDFDAKSTGSVDGWLSITGLEGKDTLHLENSFTFGVTDKDGNLFALDSTTPVGVYPVTVGSLTEADYPVLRNYIVAKYDGVAEIYPREIVVTPTDLDWYVEDDGTPTPYAKFELLNDDEESYTDLGTDADTDYTAMPLIGSDTVASVLGLYRDSSLAAYTEYDKRSVFGKESNISYSTEWYSHAPAIYLDVENDPTLEPCAWCENRHGFALGTDHWKVSGYVLRINQNADEGSVLTVAAVQNPLGETVQNYTLRYVDGLLRVHPKLRFQLKATVPMYVCMYGYAGDGSVVTPTNYGITNLSNGAIKVTDLTVSQKGSQTVGWNIVDKDPQTLQRGEMTMRLNGLQLTTGSNAITNPEKWRIPADTQQLLPLTCYIAGGNVNERQESYVTSITYTVAEYGVTVPEVDGMEIPDTIHGEPVTKTVG